MLTTREFQRRRGPLILSRRVGGDSERSGVDAGDRETWFKTHACLLSSGFYRRVYAFSASERSSSFRIAEDEDDEEGEKEDWCRFALPWPTAVRLRLGRIDGPRATCSTYLLLSFWPPASTDGPPSRSPSHPTSYIYGISRNLCFDGWQSTDCCPSPYSRFDAKSFIYRNIWLCCCDVVAKETCLGRI